jgi:hypothetical protein
MEEGRPSSDGDAGGKTEDGGMKTPEGGHKNEERGTGMASGAFPIGSEDIRAEREVKQTRGRTVLAGVSGRRWGK